LLAQAAACPIWAKFSDIWGRKLALLGAVALFAGASTMAALSVSMRMLIAARALQGTAGGGLSSMINITVSDLFSVRRRTLFLGLVEIVWAVAGSSGPILGGVFTQLLSWRWCFWINLPFSALTFVLLFVFLDVHNPRTRLREGLKAVDWFGTLSMLAVTLLVLLGLDFGGATFPWNSPKVICLIVFGTLMIGFFLFSEKRLAKYPLMPLHIFSNKSNSAALAVCFTQGVVFMGQEYYLPLYFQSVKQASPLRSGVLILPITVSEALCGIFCGVLIHQTGRYREIIWTGMLLMTVGVGLYTLFDVTTPIGELVGLQLIGGIGAGFLFEAPLIAIQAMTSQADTATATGTFSFIRSLATAMSIVIGGAIFQNGMDNRASTLRESGLNATVVASLSGGNAAANVDIVRTISDDVQKKAILDAFAWSLKNLWIMYACISGVGLIASVFIVQSHLSKEHTETRTGIDKMSETRRDRC
jgi:MFS family permease